MSYIITSAYAKIQMQDIMARLISFRGVSKDEKVDYNGTTYTAGDLMGDLRKDYSWWETQYNKALSSEGSNIDAYPSYKLAKGWECL